MSHFNLERVIRPNILALHPYRCARDDYQSGILLDANENSLGHSIALSKDDELDNELLKAQLNRYPDPAQVELKSKIAQLRSIQNIDHIFLGVGSDEVIDLLMRITCIPGPQGDAIMITPPTYGMYAVCAQVNDVKVLKVSLNTDFSLEVSKVRNVPLMGRQNRFMSHFRSRRHFEITPKRNSFSFVHPAIQLGHVYHWRASERFFLSKTSMDWSSWMKHTLTFLLPKALRSAWYQSIPISSLCKH